MELGTPTRMAMKKWKLTSVGKDVDHWSPFTLLVRMRNDGVTVEGSLAVPQQVKHTMAT